MPKFDALRQPWIPAERADGSIHEYGIMEVIEKAPELRCLNDSSPVFLYGMYRLLVAFLTDALRPKSIDELMDIYETGSFPMERIEDYIAECEKDGPCFDLFDKDRPFLQSAYNNELDKQQKTAAIMVMDLPTGNNPIHFDHRYEETHAFAPAICARALCSINLFCPADVQNPSGINGAPPWYVIVRGSNLFESLLFSIWLPYGELSFDDPPIAWCNTSTIIPGQEILRTSYLYGLTWQARRICLVPSASGICTYSGRYDNTLVRQVYYQKGWKFAGHALWVDPHTPRRKNENGISSVKPRDGRAAWRDMAPLALSGKSFSGNSKVKTYRRPEVVNQYIGSWMPELYHLQSQGAYFQVEVFGLSTNQAKLISWIHDLLVLPPGIVTSANKADLLQAEIEIVESVSKEINKQIKRTTLADNGANRSKTKKGGISDNIILSMEQRFFDEARKLLYGVLIEDLLEVQEDTEGWRNQAITPWRQQMKIMSKLIFDEAVNKSGTKAVNFKLSVKPRKELYQNLAKILSVEEVNPNG